MFKHGTRTSSFSADTKCAEPTGIGVLYGRETLLESMPPFLGGGGMINRVTTEGFTAADLPEKFEAGTPPIAEAIGLEAAIQYIRSIGLEKIEQHEQTLARHAEAGLTANPRAMRVAEPGERRKVRHCRL